MVATVLLLCDILDTVVVVVEQYAWMHVKLDSRNNCSYAVFVYQFNMTPKVFRKLTKCRYNFKLGAQRCNQICHTIDDTEIYRIYSIVRLRS